MKYLLIAGTLFDAAGWAMMKGAINGISKLDPEAKFASLHTSQHHRDGFLDLTFEEPFKNGAAFQWADGIIDTGGLFDSQGKHVGWCGLRHVMNKTYVFMSQSFKRVDPKLLEDAYVVARGQRSAENVRAVSPNIRDLIIAPDLSFLIEPKPWEGKKYKRVFITHIIKQIQPMYDICDPETDVQLITKHPQGKQVWEPELPIPKYSGTVEENFGLIASADEVHTARYQPGCAAILAGKEPIIYSTGDPKYDLKYADLMDYYGKSKEELREEAMASCRLAVKVIKG